MLGSARARVIDQTTPHVSPRGPRHMYKLGALALTRSDLIPRLEINLTSFNADFKMKFLAKFILAAAMGATGVSSHAVDTLQVETTIGRVHGMINASTPNVAQYLGIPFAEPPVGELRFKPPQQKSRGKTLFANQTGPSCPQYLLNKQNAPSVYTYDAPWLQPYGAIDEDCLTLNVWTPLKKSKEPLPVLIWVFGGGFYEGGLLTNGFDPSNWIQRTESHIVIALKYLSPFSLARCLADTMTLIATATTSSAFPMRAA